MRKAACDFVSQAAFCVFSQPEGLRETLTRGGYLEKRNAGNSYERTDRTGRMRSGADTGNITDIAVYTHGPNTGHRITAGSGFGHEMLSWVIQVGNTDFLIDLLFYSRALSRLVPIEPKIRKFKPEHRTAPLRHAFAYIPVTMPELRR